MTSKVQLVWYYHQPTVSTDAEVNDMVVTSLLPLLRAHAATSRKFTIAITGVLVERLAEVAPSALAQLRALLESGICELGGTTYHEAFPPFLPIRYLRRQLDRDLTVKAAHLGDAPTFFHPTAFTWASSLAFILPEFGFRRFVIDETHYTYATATQLWRWTVGPNAQLASTLQTTMLDRRELHIPYRYRTDDSQSLTCFIRDFELVREFSLGSSGLIHRPLESEARDRFLEYVTRLEGGGRCLTLADDGDRITPVSLAAYQRVLHEFPEDVFVTPRDGCGEREEKELVYLPSFSIADHHNFWLADIDSVHYLRLLDEMYARGVPRELEDDLLELQDVFFLFWKTVPRKRYYLEKALTLWKRVCDVTPAPTRRAMSDQDG